MSNPAPSIRTVDALTGERSPVLGILATADHISSGLAAVENLTELESELETPTLFDEVTA